MKNLNYENFYVDLDHPRALIRDVEEIIDDEDINNLSYCPIIFFHNLRNTNSKITFNREPSLNRLKQLKEIYGINHILTCLCDRNYDTYLKAATDYCNINRIEFNLEFSKLRDLSIDVIKEKLIDNILEIFNRLKNDNITLLIHRASGEMKNTIILYSLLRLSGEKKEESIEIIRCFKNGSKKSIGDFNIEFIERNIIQKLLGYSTNK